MTIAATFDPATASLSAQLVNVMLTLQWTAGLSEAVSNYAPPVIEGAPPVAANGDERFVCPEAAGQLALLEAGVGGIKIGEDVVSQLQALFTQQRTAASVAEELVSQTQYYSAAILFHGVAEKLLEVAGAFNCHVPWGQFLRRNHHRVAAAFLHERAADMFTLTGDHKKAARGFFHSATLYSERIGEAHEFRETYEWGKRSLSKALDANVKVGNLVEAIHVARKLSRHETVVDLVKRELELRAGQPDRDVSRAPNSELWRIMEDSLFKLGGPEDAAIEMGKAQMYTGDTWRKAAGYHLHCGNDVKAAFAYTRTVGAELAAQRGPDWRTLIEATLAVWGYERAKAKGEEVEIKDIIAARMLFASVLERMELFGSAIDVRESTRNNYADDSDAEAIDVLRGKVREIQTPRLDEEDAAEIDAAKAYEAAEAYMKAGNLGIAAELFNEIIESTNPNTILSEFPARAKKGHRLALWLSAVISADKFMTIGRGAERTGDLEDAFQTYSNARKVLEMAHRRHEQKIIDSNAGVLNAEDGIEDFYADSVEAMIRVARAENLLSALERAQMLFRAALILSKRRIHSNYPIRRVGNLYRAAGDELMKYGDGGVEVRRQAQVYYRESVGSYLDNDVPVGVRGIDKELMELAHNPIEA